MTASTLKRQQSVRSTAIPATRVPKRDDGLFAAVRLTRTTDRRTTLRWHDTEIREPDVSSRANRVDSRTVSSPAPRVVRRQFNCGWSYQRSGAIEASTPNRTDHRRRLLFATWYTRRVPIC